MILVNILLLLDNVFHVKNIVFLKYPIPEIPDDFENKSGTDRVLKKTSGSGRVSGTRWALLCRQDGKSKIELIEL